MPDVRRLVAVSAVVFMLATLASCSHEPAESAVAPDVVGMRLDLAEGAINAAGVEHVHATNSVTVGFIVHWENWVVVAQDSRPGTDVDPTEDFTVEVGPLDDTRTLALLDQDAPAREQMERIQAERQEDAPAPSPDPTLASDYEGMPAEFGLPEAYGVDRGTDERGDERPDVIRRDLAEYAAEVRLTDPSAADGVTDAIMATPAAWCSFWLPRHTPDEFDDWQAQAAGQAGDFGADLGVAFTSQNTASVHAVMVRARDLAGQRFCPHQAASPGAPVDSEPTGGAWVSEGHVNFDETVLDVGYFYNSWTGHPSPIGRDTLKYAYLTMLGMPTHQWNPKQWPLVLSCEMSTRSATPGEWLSQANTIREDNSVSTIFDIDDQLRAVAEHEPSHFAILVSRDIACR